jgi:hypothetical protein
LLCIKTAKTPLNFIDFIIKKVLEQYGILKFIGFENIKLSLGLVLKKKNITKTEHNFFRDLNP